MTTITCDRIVTSGRAKESGPDRAWIRA